jgi:uncharacterized OB-fold protein
MSFRQAPTATPDSQFFWDGLAARTLLIQRCTGCGRLRHPPRPMCPWCNDLAWDTVEASGRGTVHSFVMPQHPRFPFLEYPYVVALVDLEEGTRLVSNLVDVAPEEASIGMAVEVCFAEFDGGLVLHQFRPAAQR